MALRTIYFQAIIYGDPVVGWNLLQFKTKIGKNRQKCMVPRVVPKTPKYPLYLKIIAEKSMPRVKPTNAKMSSIPILQYLLGGENT